MSNSTEYKKAVYLNKKKMIVNIVAEFYRI